MVCDHEAGNRRIAALAQADPEHFVSACTVSPWRGVAARPILADAVDGGARMLVLAPVLQGFSPCDFDLLGPVMEAADERRLPIYLHTGPQGCGTPSQVMLLAERFAECRLILGHCGSTDHAYDMPAALTRGLANVWFEISFVRPWAVPRYLELAGPGRLMFGSGMPRNDLGFELQFLDSILPIRDHPGLYGRSLQRRLEEVRP